jgi:hypothetical protein
MQTLPFRISGKADQPRKINFSRPDIFMKNLLVWLIKWLPLVSDGLN